MARRDSKGNKKKGEGRFVMLTFHMLDCPAGKSLKPNELAVLVRLSQRYSGSNNGRLFMSSREVAEAANINKDTAARVLKSLAEKGFIRVVRPGGFGTNGGKASTYEITQFALSKDVPAKRLYQDWRPPKEKPRIKRGSRLSETKGQQPKLRIVK